MKKQKAAPGEFAPRREAGKGRGRCHAAKPEVSRAVKKINTLIPEDESVYFAGGRLGLEFEHSKFALAIFKIASSKVACRIVEGFAFFKASDLYGPAFKKVEAFAVGGHAG